MHPLATAFAILVLAIAIIIIIAVVVVVVVVSSPTPLRGTHLLVHPCSSAAAAPYDPNYKRALAVRNS